MVRLRDSWPFSLSSAPTVGNPCRPLQPETVSVVARRRAAAVRLYAEVRIGVDTGAVDGRGVRARSSDAERTAGIEALEMGAGLQVRALRLRVDLITPALALRGGG